MALKFSERLRGAHAAADSLVCVGIDPDLTRLPDDLRSDPQPLLAFNRRIVDATYDLCAAYKPQIAFYSALGKESELAASIRYIRERAPAALVILDAKRGDIGSTAEMYAREAFDRYDADAVTVNPYMGDDAVLPFLQRPDKAALVLCRNSNPSAALVQTALVDGQPLFEVIARRAEQVWNRLANVMLVVGATYPDDLARVRAAAPTLPFLVPGIGEQGGSPRQVVVAGQRKDGRGLVVSASRSVLYAGSEAQIRRAAEDIHRELVGARTRAEAAAV